MPVTITGTREIPIADLTRYPGNPRRGNITEIRASVRRLGQYRTVVVRDTGTALVILAGNHTTEALAAEGHATARCEVLTCDDGDARRINLADNRLAELGGYDEDDLAALLAGLDGDYDGTGWTQDDYDALLREEPESRTDPDDVPDLPPDPVSKPGDVYALGPHRLLVGDATDMAAVGAMMDGDRADCMWTDPPYGVEYVGKTKDALTIANDGAADLPALLAGAFAVATAALKPGAAVYIAHPDRFRLTFEHSMLDAGWLFRQELVWVKNSLVLGAKDYHFRHESVLYGFTDGGAGRLGRGGARWYGDDAQTTVFEVDRPSRSEQHPTMKPVALVTAMIGNSLPKRGIVYDPFGGSGSTLIAAHQLGHRARLVELDPRYADVICQRYTEHTGIAPERIQ